MVILDFSSEIFVKPLFTDIIRKFKTSLNVDRSLWYK